MMIKVFICMVCILSVFMYNVVIVFCFFLGGACVFVFFFNASLLLSTTGLLITGRSAVENRSMMVVMKTRTPC